MSEHNVSTLGRLFLNSCRAHQKPNRMMVKRGGAWTLISTEELETSVRRISLGFQALGLRPGDRVALLSENRPEWVMVDFAALAPGGVTVPIYTSLLPEHIRYIIDNSGAKIVVCSDRDLYRKVEVVRSVLPSIEHVVLIEGETPSGTLALAEVMEKGRQLEAASPGLFERSVEGVRPGDLASIIYTSGTVGPPKGVMLSQANFVSNINSLTDFIDFREDDTALSFLPLSHVLERTGTLLFFHVGSTIAYAEGVETVAENMLEVRPTLVVSVPRLFEKLYARVMDQVLAESRLKRAVFFWALATGKKYTTRVIAGKPIPKGLALKHGLARRLVFSKITSRTGGRMRYFICGGAPLSKDITEFLYALGLIVLPGYGLTETSPVLTANRPGDYRFGTVGKTIPRVELRIAEDGEILARGPNVMMGYYKNEADTREVMKDGWLHTGDIGRLDAEGFLTITDRKKDIIVTSGGKNVAPQPIEILIQSSPFIASAVVVGSSRRFISALIVPNFNKLENYARAQSIPFADRTELCRRPEVADFLLGEVSRLTTELAPFEKVKKIAVLDRDFEIEMGEVTPTLKVKRNIVEQKYADLIESIYKD
jgi:long-chain acyl-CoA synthetase